MDHLAFLTAQSRCFVASPLMLYKRAWLCLKTEHSRSQCELPPGVGGGWLFNHHLVHYGAFTLIPHRRLGECQTLRETLSLEVWWPPGCRGESCGHQPGQLSVSGGHVGLACQRRDRGQTGEASSPRAHLLRGAQGRASETTVTIVTSQCGWLCPVPAEGSALT